MLHFSLGRKAWVLVLIKVALVYSQIPKDRRQQFVLWTLNQCLGDIAPGRRANTSIWTQVTPGGVTQCARECSFDARCASFFFNTGSNNCICYGVIFIEKAKLDLIGQPSPGTKYYHLTNDAGICNEDSPENSNAWQASPLGLGVPAPICPRGQIFSSSVWLRCANDLATWVKQGRCTKHIYTGADTQNLAHDFYFPRPHQDESCMYIKGRGATTRFYIYFNTPESYMLVVFAVDERYLVVMSGNHFLSYIRPVAADWFGQNDFYIYFHSDSEKLSIIYAGGEVVNDKLMDVPSTAFPFKKVTHFRIYPEIQVRLLDLWCDKTNTFGSA